MNIVAWIICIDQILIRESGIYSALRLCIVSVNLIQGGKDSLLT